MYAIIETGGKQYKVNEGDVIYVEKLNVNEGDTVEFGVKAVSIGNDFKVGTPVVEGAVVSGKVIANGKGKKIYVMKYKSNLLKSVINSAASEKNDLCHLFYQPWIAVI